MGLLKSIWLISALVVQAVSAQAWPLDANCPLLEVSAVCNGNTDDILYVHIMLDVSGSVKEVELQETSVNFLDKLMKEVYCTRWSLPAEQTQIWIGVWSGNFEIKMEIGAGFSRLGKGLQDLRSQVTNGGTKPSPALKEAKRIAESSPSGARNIAILFTDGEMTDPPAATDAANSLKTLEVSKNLKLITVGIGPDIDEPVNPNKNYPARIKTVKDYLDEVASSPELSLKVEGFTEAAFDEVLADLKKELVCDNGSGGAIEAADSKYPTPRPTPPPQAPTTGSPTPEGYVAGVPTRQPIDYGVPTEPPTNAAPSAALGRAAPLLLVATWALQQL